MRILPLLLIAACTAPKDLEDTGPAEETAAPDTDDSSPPVETGDSSPPVETAETGETAETAEPIIDNDSDGVSPDDGDCNDADPLIHPGAADVLCDNVDADCDGVGEDDAFAIGEARYADLATALAAAADGDTVDVCPGIWVQNVAIETPMTLTLRGYSGSAIDTELDGGSLGPVLVLGPGVKLTIEDIGFTNGVATWRNEDVEQSGGAIWADEAFLTLRRARFYNNIAQDVGGAVAVRVGDGPDQGLLVEDTEFTDNRASTSGGALAVIGAGDADVSITGTTFDTNQCPNRGGAVHLEGAPLSVTVADSSFATNSTSGRRGVGAGIAAEGDEVRLTVTDTTFSGNTSGADGAGIGLEADRSVLYAESTTFSSNIATGGGGGLHVDSDGMELELVSVVFDGNLGSTQGGAAEIEGGGTARFDTVVATDNSAGNAGGAYYVVEGSGLSLTLTLDGGMVNTNGAGIGGGGGIYASGARIEANAVDFGSGVSTNSPEDVYLCSQDWTTSSTFVFDESTGTYCQ